MNGTTARRSGYDRMGAPDLFAAPPSLKQRLKLKNYLTNLVAELL